MRVSEIPIDGFVSSEFHGVSLARLFIFDLIDGHADEQFLQSDEKVGGQDSLVRKAELKPRKLKIRENACVNTPYFEIVIGSLDEVFVPPAINRLQPVPDSPPALLCKCSSFLIYLLSYFLPSNSFTPISLNLNFWILPLAVFGYSFTQKTYLGTR